MIAKAEKNLAANRPGSKAALSIQSIIKDLQDLDKSLITKNELEAMKTKMKKLEDENSRMKTELQATEADRKLYYNQFHQNVKELNDLKAESHSERKFLCGRCPYATKERGKLNEHEQKHIENDLKYSGVEGAKKCTLCDVFFSGSGLTHHNKRFH